MNLFWGRIQPFVDLNTTKLNIYKLKYYSNIPIIYVQTECYPNTMLGNIHLLVYINWYCRVSPVHPCFDITSYFTVVNSKLRYPCFVLLVFVFYSYYYIV